jgi:hypothetical protein
MMNFELFGQSGRPPSRTAQKFNAVDEETNSSGSLDHLVPLVSILAKSFLATSTMSCRMLIRRNLVSDRLPA